MIFPNSKGYKLTNACASSSDDDMYHLCMRNMTLGNLLSSIIVPSSAVKNIRGIYYSRTQEICRTQNFSTQPKISSFIFVQCKLLSAQWSTHTFLLFFLVWNPIHIGKPGKSEYWVKAVIKVLTKERTNAKEIYRGMAEVYGVKLLIAQSILLWKTGQ